MKSEAKNTTDLVPASVLLKIAERIKTTALAIALSKRSGRVGQLDPIKIGTPKITQKQIEINISLDLGIVPEAAAYEWGSGLHSKTSPEYISIDAKNYPVLVFQGTNAYAGQEIRTPHVNHPGVKARPYIQPAKEKTRQQNLADVRKAVNQNIRLIISARSPNKPVVEQPY